jgi:ElaA protein
VTCPVRHAPWAALDPATLHDVVRLRVDVFVVEQACPYPELDGRDVEPGTEHVWVAAAGLPVAAYLRVLAEPDGARRVGRVVTHPSARGRGLAALLLSDVLSRHADVPLVLDAQAHLEAWYARFGFAATGPAFDEDGIAHVPMRREPDAVTAGRTPAPPAAPAAR